MGGTYCVESSRDSSHVCQVEVCCAPEELTDIRREGRTGLLPDRQGAPNRRTCLDVVAGCQQHLVQSLHQTGQRLRPGLQQVDWKAWHCTVSPVQVAERAAAVRAPAVAGTTGRNPSGSGVEQHSLHYNRPQSTVTPACSESSENE